MNRFVHMKTVRLDSDLNTRLQACSDRMKLSDADIFRLALVDFLDGDKAPRPPRRALTCDRIRVEPKGGK